MPDAIERAAGLIRAGRLVAFPTETVYGLGANALDPEAVRRVFEAKGRPSSSPLIVHVASIRQARELAADWPQEAELLSAEFWPGPLTLVLRKSARVPDIVTAGLDSVGLRMPANRVALELIRLAGVPIAAPSANRFTGLSPTRAGHVAPELADMVLDGGPATVGIESTVIRVASGTCELLRPGGAARAAIERVVGPLLEAGAPTSVDAHLSPGQHRRHYRPRTRLVLAEPGSLPDAGRGEFLSWSGVGTISMPAVASDYAARLYAMLHELDAIGLDWIAVEPVPAGPDWDGVRDRLTRAAAD